MTLTRDKAAPGVLAAELARAQARRDAAVEQADSELASKRQSVIQRGAERVNQIAALQSELASEKSALEQVLAGV